MKAWAAVLLEEDSRMNSRYTRQLMWRRHFPGNRTSSI